jgi:hypothetical protein
VLPDPTAAEANEIVAHRRTLAPPPEEEAMSEIDLPETDAEVQDEDELDGCELDFTASATSDEEIAALLAPPSAPMRAKTEEEWEQEQEEEEES